MADVILDVLDALLTTTPAEKALREARAVGDSQSAQDDRIGALIGSAYRGGVPTDGQGCSVCGKRLGADDPVLTLASRGSVCTMCFTRGG